MAFSDTKNVTDAYGRVRVTVVNTGETFKMTSGYGRFLGSFAGGAAVATTYAAYQDMDGNAVAGGTVAANMAWLGQTFNSLSGVSFTPATLPAAVYFVKD